MSTVEERLHANREMRKNREVSAMRSLSPLRKMRTSTNNMVRLCHTQTCTILLHAFACCSSLY